MAKSTKKSTGTSAPDTSVTSEAVTEVKKVASVATNEGQTNMSDSIIQFSQDIATAEPPAPLPPGDYTMSIVSVERKVSQNTGNAYAQVGFFLSPDGYPLDFTEGDPDGMRFNYSLVPLEDTARARHRLRKFIEAIGAKGGTQIDLNDWIGLTATVTVEHETWEGEVRARIARVVKP